MYRSVRFPIFRFSQCLCKFFYCYYLHISISPSVLFSFICSSLSHSIYSRYSGHFVVFGPLFCLVYMYFPLFWNSVLFSKLPIFLFRAIIVHVFTFSFPKISSLWLFFLHHYSSGVYQYFRSSEYLIINQSWYKHFFIVIISSIFLVHHSMLSLAFTLSKTFVRGFVYTFLKIYSLSEFSLRILWSLREIYRENSKNVILGFPDCKQIYRKCEASIGTLSLVSEMG